MNEVMLWCGEQGMMCFHCNVGNFLTADGRHISTGLPKGFPDLMVIGSAGSTAFVETKVHPRKPTDEQTRFIAELNRRGFRAGVAYSLDEAKAIIKG